MTMTILFGINNCDTVKKARKWFDSNSLDHSYHDFRNDGLTENQLQQWIDAIGYETLVNKRSTTWKQLGDDAKQSLDGDSAKALMLANPTLIKRPVVIDDTGVVSVGFKEADFQQRFLSLD
ncbi:ArsC family reductase [Sinobacterium norvegicum]